MTHCVVLTNTTDVYVDSTLNIPDKIVWNMYNFAWNILD